MNPLLQFVQGLELPLFFQEEAKEAVIDYTSCQVNRKKQKAQLAHDEFRQSLVITYNLQLKAEHLRQDYFDSVAAYNYFRLAFDEYKLDKEPNALDDKIPVKPPRECKDNRTRVYQSGLLTAV